MTTRDEYRTLRAQHPDAGASTCYRWTRSPKPYALDWEDETGIATIDGWDIEAIITDDYDADASDTYGTLTNEWEKDAFPNPYWREWHKDDPIVYDHSDQCSSRHDDDGAARWYVPSCGTTLDELRDYFRSSGVARHDAYARALAQLRAMADDCRRMVADRYGQGRYAISNVSVTVSLAGVEVCSTGYGGYSWERDYSKPLEPQLDAIVDDAVREALAEAPLAIEETAKAEEAKATALLARASSLRSTFEGMTA